MRFFKKRTGNVQSHLPYYTAEIPGEPEVGPQTEYELKPETNVILHLDFESLFLDLKTVRIASELSVYQLSGELGVRGDTLRAWESGDRHPTLTQLNKWVEALGARVWLVIAEVPDATGS